MKKLLSDTLHFFCDWLVYLIAIPITSTFAILAISGSHDFVFPAGLSIFGALVALSSLAYTHSASVKDRRNDEAEETSLLASKIALGGILLLVSLGIKFAEVVLVVLIETKEIMKWVETSISILAGAANFIATILLFIAIWIGSAAIQKFSQILSRRGLQNFLDS